MSHNFKYLCLAIFSIGFVYKSAILFAKIFSKELYFTTAKNYTIILNI
jgi:hypothetical protein|nr:MAG TPA: hypothetical protein [Caudoviricetes sp.]